MPGTVIPQLKSRDICREQSHPRMQNVAKNGPFGAIGMRSEAVSQRYRRICDCSVGHGASPGSRTSTQNLDNLHFLIHNPPAFKNTGYFACQLGAGSPKHPGFVHPHTVTLILGWASSPRLKLLSGWEQSWNFPVLILGIHLPPAQLVTHWPLCFPKCT